MPTPRLTDDAAQAAMNAYAEHGTAAAAAEAIGVNPGTFNSRLREAERRKMLPTNGSAMPGSLRALKVKISKLEAELKAHRSADEQTQIIKGVIGNMVRKVEELDPPDWIVRPRAKASAPGVPTLFMSDLHWGERVFPAQINNVNEYNIRIAHERTATLVSSALHLLKIISPRMDYPGIVLALGGDNISGNIHDELTATNELNTMPTVLDLFSVYVGVITHLAGVFGRVFVPCVSGNHGRDTRKVWAKDRHATSFDWLLYKFLAKHFEGNSRITFFIPDGPDAYYKIYDHAYLLTHGDQFRGGDGMIGCLGPILRGDHKKRSRNAQVDMEYNTMLMGHWHSYIHHGRVIVNGSMKGYDEYAYSSNFGFEPPQQALWLTHQRHGITYRMPVNLDRKRQSATSAWVSVPE